MDGKSPQIRRELTAGEDGAHSRGTTSPPLQQLEWTAARRKHTDEQQDASLCDASAGSIPPTPGAFPAMALACISQVVRAKERE